ncbi:hypothetical protein JCM8097_000096 [Rhodosporidiobolus ruineniae]
MSAEPLRVPSPTPHSLRPRHPRFNPTLLTVRIPSSNSSSRPQLPPQDLPHPRWRTKEFYLYYAVFLLVVPRMCTTAARVSRASNPLYWHYQHRLKPGWLFGWKVDITDHQYYLFRSFLPLLALLVGLHLLLSHSFRHLFRPSRAARARFSAAFSCVLICALHGTSALKIALIMALNWAVVRFGVGGEKGGRGRRGWWRRDWTPFAVWGVNVGVLFANELAGGYQFGRIHSSLAVLDAYPGLLPRWHISWNISMLRLVSWSMEHYWALSAPSSASLPEPPTSPLQKASGRPSPANAPKLDPSALFSPPLYFAYVLYPPLYLAGPIMSYPSFVSQLGPAPAPSFSPAATGASAPLPSPAAEYPPSRPLLPTPSASEQAPDPDLSPRALFSYALRFAACLMTMELVLHSMYVVAIKDSGAGWWDGLTAEEVAMVGFWNLIVVWLKLLLPWRLFRLWALLDGLNPPENMVRCMANNYSTLGFWRSWHRSYNLWVIRYLYIPLGGSSRPLLATLGVFTFVALWHDLRLRLLIWGWAVTAFVVPEMLGRKLVPASKFAPRPWFRPLAALGGVANVLLMMTANLVGFVVGLDGARAVWEKMVGGWEGRLFLLAACACLFVAVQVMFEYREEERRRGIDRKC